MGLGDEVWVVYVTSGDGSWPSAWKVTGSLFPGPEEYLELGRARIEEAKAGAKVLGLDTTHLVFLGFPDGELADLVFEHQNDEIALKSHRTRLDRSAYDPLRFAYRGRDIMLAIDEQVVRRHADRVFLPHPLDAHPDHWATAAFLPATRASGQRIDPRGRALTLYYMVHRPGYPNRYGDDLLPPDELAGSGHHWYTLPLSPARVARKRAALKDHWSQTTTFGPDLYQYVACNELFDVPLPDSGVARGDAPAVGSLVPRIDSVGACLSPIGHSTFRLYLPDAPRSGCDYRLHIWSSGPALIDRTIDLKEDTSEQSCAGAGRLSADAQLRIADPVCVTSDSGWTVYVPSRWFNGMFLVYFTSDVRWKGNLLNHSGVGWAAPSWY
ncbi:MAG: PIG-L family deacetylase [candidate division WOR-3 bacterium]|nr:PIG-L family deacetylase [candidate division WOR-3 bacterium]